VLERLPDEKAEYKPHEKSMSLLKLANHTAEIPSYVSMILGTTEFDLAGPRAAKPAPAASTSERLAHFDRLVADARGKLASASDDELQQAWRMRAGDRVLVDGTRYNAVRMIFFNHMIHHRAQLGLYLRLNDCSVPAIYGTSADEG
jgi:uncharacterized damage-inducible protein DinB